MYVERFMTEAGLAHVPTATAAFRLAQEIAHETLRTGRDPLVVIGQIYRLWVATGYAVSIVELGTLEDDFYISTSNPEDARRMVRERLQEFADLPNLP